MTGATAAECPGPLTLFQYANGHLDRSQSERIAMHVRRCSRCAERVQQTGNDGRSLADALEPRDAMALETAEDVLRRLDLDLELAAEDVVEVEAPAKARRPTPGPPARPQLPPPKALRGKLPPPAKRPTPMGGPPLVAPSAPPLRAPASAPVGPPPTFASVPVGQTKVAPPPRPASAGDNTVRTPAPSAPPAAPRSSGAPPVPVVRTNQKRDSEPAPVVDAGRSRKWLFVSIAVFAVLGIGAAGALILYPRLTGEELRWASVVAVFDGGDAEKRDAKSERAVGGEEAEPATAAGDEAEAEPVADAKAESDAKAEPAAEPAGDANADAAAEAKAEPAADAAEPAADAKADAAEPAPDAKADAAEPAPDAKPDAAVEAEPAAEASPEPVAEAKAEPTAEAKAEPTAEAKPEPVAEAKAEPAAEAKPEPAADAKPEPAAAPTPSDSAAPNVDAAPAPKPSSLPRFSEPVGSRDPGEAIGLAKRGALALRKSDLETADTYFHRALAHDPRNATALSGLAALHLGQGRHRTAVKFAAKAVNAAPQDADLRILLGDAYVETLAYAHARREYEKAAALGHRGAAARLAKLQERLAQ